MHSHLPEPDELDFIYIEWFDSASWEHWSDLPSPKTAVPLIRSCGVLIQQTNDAYFLASSVDCQNEKAAGMIQIPIICIKRVLRFDPRQLAEEQ